MSMVQLSTERLTMLPPRCETAPWGGLNINIPVVVQTNVGVQTIGVAYTANQNMNLGNVANLNLGWINGMFTPPPS